MGSEAVMEAEAVMVAKRTPATERYDALVDFDKTLDAAPTSAYGLVKLTYDIGTGACVPAPAEPLFHDVRDPAIEPRLCAGSDYWPYKVGTDVVVTGSAWHPGGAAAPHRSISLQVGPTLKSVAVFGRRVVSRGALGTPIFSDPEPFVELPVVNANAYGGWDARVPMPFSHALADVVARQYDHPGIYPRNPFGKGYVVVPELPDNEVELPNLEDPNDRLTPERFFVRDPSRWHRQPLPWCLDWSSALMFHRYVWLGADAWFPAPADELMPEVQRGMLPRRYREAAGEFVDAPGAPLPFLQEASLGMVMHGLRPGTPIVVAGMNPEAPRSSFALPEPPRLAFSLGDGWQPAAARLHSVLVLPGRSKLQLVYGASYGPLGRKYVPGVHARIPLALRVDDDPPIAYESPPTIGEMYRARQNGGA
jgi:hypothetical protein